MAKKHKAKKVVAPTPASLREKEPPYMVQIGDPKMLRKDLLESLRDIIIFMQGYEKFRKIQEEKLATFATLRSDLKEINSLVDNKLKHYFPKGKLKALSESKQLKEKEREMAAPVETAALVQPAPKIQSSAPPVSKSELDELESQLKDIESQLRNVG